MTGVKARVKSKGTAGCYETNRKQRLSGNKYSGTGAVSKCAGEIVRKPPEKPKEDTVLLLSKLLVGHNAIPRLYLTF